MFLIETKNKIMKLQYCVYVLQSAKDNNFYVGSTTNLKARLTSHFHGLSKATAPRRPFNLIFCEYFVSNKDSLRREKYLKTTAGRKALKTMLKEFFNKQLLRE